MKTLYLVRHAKSSWEDDALSDRERPLSKRGEKTAPQMGQRLKAAGVSVQRMISSPATRALSTAQFLASAIGYRRGAISQDAELYFEGADAMLACIQRVDDEIQTLMLVGHNPDITEFLNKLCSKRVVNMPTCAIATILLDSSWSDVSYHSGRLQSYDFPKNRQPD